LPFLARGKGALAVRPAIVLAQKLRDIVTEVDAKGYVQRTVDALLPTFSTATRAAIEADLGGKGGSELVARADGRAKFHAAHSSAALAANTFGPFLREHTAVPFAGEIYPEVVDSVESEGGVPSRLIKTDAGVDRQEGTPWEMFAGSMRARSRRPRSRWTASRGRVLGG
jgi:hypothetical protein